MRTAQQQMRHCLGHPRFGRVGSTPARPDPRCASSVHAEFADSQTHRPTCRPARATVAAVPPHWREILAARRTIRPSVAPSHAGSAHSATSSASSFELRPKRLPSQRSMWLAQRRGIDQQRRANGRARRKLPHSDTATSRVLDAKLALVDSANTETLVVGRWSRPCSVIECLTVPNFCVGRFRVMIFI